MRELDADELEHDCVRTDAGYISCEHAERVAICVCDGRLSLQEAPRIASEETRNRALSWHPGLLQPSSR